MHRLVCYGRREIIQKSGCCILAAELTGVKVGENARDEHLQSHTGCDQEIKRCKIEA
jgi:hypothetical protein